jgi:putative ABC transport system permease protein
MFRNHLLYALRTIRQNRLNSVLNIGGLTLGIASFIIIMLYIGNEMSYDRHWSDTDRIYRVSTIMDYGYRVANEAVTPYPLALSLKDHFPELTEAVRVAGNETTLTIRRGKTGTGTKQVFIVDPGFFRIFDFPFAEGSPENALTRPDGVVISGRLAGKLFSKERAVGKTLTIGPNYPFKDQTFEVVGVMEDTRNQSHLKPDIIASTLCYPQDYVKGLMENNWDFIAFYTYLKFRDPGDVAGFKQSLPVWSKQTVQPWLEENEFTYQLNFKLDPVWQIHFLKQYDHDISTNMDIGYIRIFGYIAAFILIIVSINYINLSTAKAINRANEVGLRKTMGAGNISLIKQNMSESVVLVLLAFIPGVVLAELILPGFNNLMNTDLSFTSALLQGKNVSVFIITLVVSLLLGMFSSTFPAFILSRYQPAQLVGRNIANLSAVRLFYRSTHLRKGLVLFQFTFTILLIIATMTIDKQLTYLVNKDLGFEKDRLVILHVPEKFELRAEIPKIKAELKKIPGVNEVSCCFNFPGLPTNKMTFHIIKNGRQYHEMINFYMVDEDFFRLMDLELKEGQYFSDLPVKQARSGFIINEAAVKIFGEDPVGRIVKSELGQEGKIIGITRNFHYQPLHRPVEPLVYMYGEVPRYMGLKIKGADITTTMQEVENIWKKYTHQYVYIEHSLNEKLTDWYPSERSMLAVFGYMSFLTLFLACMGLFGLSAFMAAKRRREVGIRKAMGGSSREIINLMLQRYMKWVLLANLITWPLAWIAMKFWLNTFAYHTEPDIFIFLAATGISIVLALFTLVYHASKAANINPAEVLQEE